MYHTKNALISIGGDDTIHPKWMVDGINDISNPNSGIKLALSNLEVAYEDIIFYDSY